MKAFFTASKSGKEKYQDAYDKIVHTLKQKNIEIIGLEVQSYEDLLEKDLIQRKDKDDVHYTYIRKGISIANIVIIEASVDSFRLGHEATLALLYNKPVLCISSNTDYSKNIKHPQFFAEKYEDLNQLENIINKFVDDFKKKFLSIRFNAFLSPEQKNFLEWYGNKTNKNISEVIRDFIDERITESPDYFNEPERK